MAGGWLGGCRGSDEPPTVAPDEGAPEVRSVYRFGPAPMAWGSIPWPDDLYLENGHLAVTGLPFADADMRDALQSALGSIDGSGTRPTIVFAFDGELDQASLPATPADSLGPDASVFLIDADTSSPDAFERLPIEVELSRDRRSLHARVAFDRALTPGRRYAAVVTDAVRARSGNHRVGQAKQLKLILDDSEPASDSREQRARQQYGSILPVLEEDGLSRTRVVALASFRAQSIERDLDDARSTLVDAELDGPRFEPMITGEALDEALGEAPRDVVGADLGTGLAHQHLAGLVHVSISTPVFADVDEGERTAFERDASDVLRPHGVHDVPCSLVVPRSIGSAAVPLVLFQHGVFGERSDALPIANELAAAGYAVLTCDGPLRGSRLPGSDTGNRFTVSSEPDGFGDVLGDLLGQDEGAGELPALHPFYYRDAVQQAVVDWMAIVETVRLGLWDDPLRAVLSNADATILRSNIGFIGVDLGAEIGIALASREPEIAAAVLGFAGGRGIDDWNAGPEYAAFAEAFGAILSSEDEQRFAPAFRSDLDVLRTLLDPASGLARAARLRRSKTNLLAFIGSEDELVPLASSEALAYALGAALVNAEPRYELDLIRDLVLPGAAISGNFLLARGAVTRVAQSLSPATHATLFTSEGFVHFEHPIEGEPVPLADSRRVTNQTAAVMRQIVFFFESHRACRSAETDVELPCAASVSPLSVPR